MALTDTKIRNAKPRGKPYILRDDAPRGLQLEVAVSGSKLWRYRYTHDGRERRMALGSYPEVSLEDARRLATDAKQLRKKGVDPFVQVRVKQEKDEAEEVKAANTFKAIALEWLQRFGPTWTAKTRDQNQRRIEMNVFPWLGHRPVDEITAPELLRVLRRVEDRGAQELAHRIKQLCSQVFRFAIATGRAERDPAQDLRGALPPSKKGCMASITEPQKVAELLRAIHGFEGTFTVRCALRIAPYLFQRPGELRRMEWAEVDLRAAEWRIPADKMKMKRDHIVPLSKQAVNILREIRPLTDHSKYVFPSVRTADRPLSENTLNVALRRLGYAKEEMTVHGLRTTASTLLHEMGYSSDIIERQLAHQDRNKIRAAYNRAEYLPERRKMMQQWADYLDGLRAGATVTPLFGKHAENDEQRA